MILLVLAYVACGVYPGEEPGNGQIAAAERPRRTPTSLGWTGRSVPFCSGPPQIERGLTETFHIDVQSRPGLVVLAPAGELDLATAARLREEAEAAEPSSAALVLDLRGVSFMDSTGLRALVAVADQCERQGRDLFVVRGPAQVRRLLEITHMARHLRLVDDPDVLPGSGPAT